MSNRLGNVYSGASLALIASLILIGCGGSDEDDDFEPEDDAGIVVVTDGGHGISDSGIVISDGGSGQCTQADQYCNTDDRNGMRCKNGDWVVSGRAARGKPVHVRTMAGCRAFPWAGKTGEN